MGWNEPLTLTNKKNKSKKRSIYELDHIIYQKLFKPVKDISWQKVVYQDPCSYCGGQQAKPSQEHILPAKDGGTKRWDNIVGACQRCNTIRDRVPLLYYLIARRSQDVVSSL